MHTLPFMIWMNVGAHGLTFVISNECKSGFMVEITCSHSDNNS